METSTMRWSGSNEVVGEEAEQRDVNERERDAEC